MLIPNMILKKCHMYIFVFFCLHVTKSKQISNILIDEAPVGRLLRTLRVRSRAAQASEAR